MVTNNKSEWGSIFDQLRLWLKWKLNFKQNKYEREFLK